MTFRKGLTDSQLVIDRTQDAWRKRLSRALEKGITMKILKDYFKHVSTLPTDTISDGIIKADDVIESIESRYGKWTGDKAHEMRIDRSMVIIAMGVTVLRERAENALLEVLLSKCKHINSSMTTAFDVWGVPESIGGKWRQPFTNRAPGKYRDDATRELTAAVSDLLLSTDAPVEPTVVTAPRTRRTRKPAAAPQDAPAPVEPAVVTAPRTRRTRKPAAAPQDAPVPVEPAVVTAPRTRRTRKPAAAPQDAPAPVTLSEDSVTQRAAQTVAAGKRTPKQRLDDPFSPYPVPEPLPVVPPERIVTKPRTYQPTVEEPVSEPRTRKTKHATASDAVVCQCAGCGIAVTTGTPHTLDMDSGEILCADCQRRADVLHAAQRRQRPQDNPTASRMTPGRYAKLARGNYRDAEDTQLIESITSALADVVHNRRAGTILAQRQGEIYAIYVILRKRGFRTSSFIASAYDDALIEAIEAVKNSDDTDVPAAAPQPVPAQKRTDAVQKRTAAPPATVEPIGEERVVAFPCGHLSTYYRRGREWWPTERQMRQGSRPGKKHGWMVCPECGEEHVQYERVSTTPIYAETAKSRQVPPQKPRTPTPEAPRSPRVEATHFDEDEPEWPSRHAPAAPRTAPAQKRTDTVQKRTTSPKATPDPMSRLADILEVLVGEVAALRADVTTIQQEVPRGGDFFGDKLRDLEGRLHAQKTRTDEVLKISSSLKRQLSEFDGETDEGYGDEG